MLKRENIRIRDPFILTDREAGIYYMYGTTALCSGSLAARNQFSVYASRDLENFDEPVVVFDGSTSPFWADRDFWAAEVHVFRGKYYLFGSCKAEGRCRATHIFVASSPLGPFVPVSPEPATPADWESLDGTFFCEDGIPYMVFCHEWKQVGDGEMCLIRLKDDLSGTIGEPSLLFRASDNPSVTMISTGVGNYVTDGPFLYEKNGRVKMIWSSFGQGRYLVLEAEADSVKGPWHHLPPKYDFDGGHAMLFEDLSGRSMISLHSPNKKDEERALFMPYEK